MKKDFILVSKRLKISKHWASKLLPKNYLVK